MGERDFDSIVIGGGSAGLAFAKEAGRLGARVLIAEPDYLGGTCVNRGCVPKKLLWMAAGQKASSRALDAFGIGSEVAISYSALRERIERKIEDIRESFKTDLEEAGVTLIRSAATSDGRDRTIIDGEVYRAETLVLATGARPVCPDVPGSELCVTSDDVFEWRTLPRSAVILGAGYIGCEFATIFSDLGVEVTLIEEDDRILSGFDDELSEIARECLEERGVRVLLSEKVVGIARNGELEVALQTGSSVSGDAVISAIGRRANPDAAGEIGSRIERAESGAVAVGRSFETSVRNVHAIGDAADRLPLTPVATRDGETLAKQLFGGGADTIDLNLVASAVFVRPPLAQVGRIEGDASASRGAPLEGGALAPSEAAGAVTARKLAFEDGRLVGAAFLSEDAADVAGVFAALVAGRISHSELGAATGIHPTFSEELLGR